MEYCPCIWVTTVTIADRCVICGGPLCAAGDCHHCNGPALSGIEGADPEEVIKVLRQHANDLCSICRFPLHDHPGDHAFDQEESAEEQRGIVESAVCARCAGSAELQTTTATAMIDAAGTPTCAPLRVKLTICRACGFVDATPDEEVE